MCRNRSTMLVDNLLYDAQAQARAIHPGAKERVEDMRKIARRNPVSRITDCECHQTVELLTLLRHLYRHLALRFTRMNSIEEQIYQYLMEQLRVTFDRLKMVC